MSKYPQKHVAQTRQDHAKHRKLTRATKTKACCGVICLRYLQFLQFTKRVHPIIDQTVLAIALQLA